MPDRNDHHHQPAAFHDAAGSLNPNLNPETPHPETTRAHEEPLGSLFDDAYALYEDGKTYLEAEVAFQKSRASYASRETGSGIVFALGALAFLPVLCGVHPLFEWTGEALEGAFRSAYLTPWFFILRSVIFFAAAMAIAALLLLRPAWSTPVSCAGLVFFAMAGTAMSVDWLMSLEPHFHSSGFGLYALILQVDTALALLVIATLAVRPKLERPGVLGGLMLTALLLWAYFAFMQYFVIWSGDLPPGVRWYQNRSGGVWGPLFQVLGLLRLAAAGLLLFGPMRKHRGWLIGIAAATLLAGALEAAWLVLPAGGTPVGWVGAVAWLLALVGLGALTLAALTGAHLGLARRSAGRASTGESAA